MKKVQIENSWLKILGDEFEKPYFISLADKLRVLYKKKKIFPHPSNIFKAYNSTPFKNVKVVIIGQDPYHGEGQAHGLCFSVPDGVKIPPSLKNIFKEQLNDLKTPIPTSGNLQKWANQGVLLLNNVLTVESGVANSHKSLGWERFTKATIESISKNLNNIVFLLWGRNAQSKEELIDKTKHLILKTVHPSPLSAYNGFFGCKHFSKTNNYLENNGIDKINWDLN